ncbi:LysM peptidoglycan-binding domain-containing protein [Paenibacillus sp. 19GGS1-52]|uniref:LysM peptidoglycan-binding domain-containing protein n=1 Tax=Paenibacillus sp. 19GGS1-52 TaxID=2758563 RepID=UPI001EFB8B88|nr:LysM peptidoglycan-binding domain-containing protein [Paenibacillus sp. 19GGS1-52]ULO08663.1 LysM peptidoglycan-binding domain-containing protein [Paenibacillus sp. 19GGS1-52]
MFDQSHGLRFDIYERIHLSEELPGIAELEEVELLPEIQVIQREDRAELYGQLLLTGLYRGEDDRTQRLEHAIPVEITVPLTRVSSFEDIGVEIENFDIDLLTMRTVNITGVLSLRGIGGAEAVAPWQQEEYTVAYSPADSERTLEISSEIREPEGDALYENSLWTFGEGTAEVTEVERETAEAVAEAAVNPLISSDSASYESSDDVYSVQQKDKESKLRTHSLDSPSDSKSELADYWHKAEKWNQEQQELTLDKGIVARETADTADIHSANQEEALLISEVEAEDELEETFSAEAVSPNSGNAFANEAFVSPEIVPPVEEKHDLKIALGSKKEQEIKEREHLTFSSLLSSSRSRKAQEIQIAEETAPVAAEVEPGNNTEWKSRFIGGFEGADLFRKVRLCIVQREETLDTIAEKYQLSARELVMYNRLSGQNVEEGQVLYIP